MRKWFRTIGLLFTATVSVYAGQAFRVKAATPVTSTAAPKTPDNNEIKLVDDADPFSNSAVPVSDPTTKPSEGTSVTNTEVSVSDAGTVEIHVNDANLVEVLRMLSLQSQKNIIASKEVQRHDHGEPVRRDRARSTRCDPARQRLRLSREGQLHLRLHDQGNRATSRRPSSR